MRFILFLQFNDVMEATTYRRWRCAMCRTLTESRRVKASSFSVWNNLHFKYSSLELLFSYLHSHRYIHRCYINSESHPNMLISTQKRPIKKQPFFLPMKIFVVLIIKAVLVHTSTEPSRHSSLLRPCSWVRPRKHFSSCGSHRVNHVSHGFKSQ